MIEMTLAALGHVACLTLEMVALLILIRAACAWFTVPILLN